MASILEQWYQLQRNAEIEQDVIELEIDLHQITAHRYDELPLKQSDHLSRVLSVTLTKNHGANAVSLANSEIFLFIRKSNGQVVALKGEVTDPVAGKFTAHLTEQSLASVGDMEIEVAKIGTDASLLSFPLIVIPVIDSIHDDDKIESSTELSALADALSKVQNWNGQVDGAVANAEAKFEAKYNAQAGDFENRFTTSQTGRDREFKTWQNLAMSQQVALDLQNQIDNQPFFRIIED